MDSMRHRAKYRSDVEPLLRYGVSKWRPSAISNFQNWQILTALRVKRSTCVTVRNFAAIGLTVAEIWRVTFLKNRKIAIFQSF